MNRFRTKKKAPEPLPPSVSSNDEALFALSSQPALVSPTTQLKKSGTSRWKKPKKPVDVKPVLDLSSALPSTDDFRTSLLMPNLSARFSMLREQDDPRSLLGKASDDSVLHPRRRSRMDFGGLGDIAEVEVSSIKSQKIRPPFAYERQDSFASEEGYGSDYDSSQNGSVMSRARPGEGNILFGGRQKVYMIPKAGSSSTRSLGKQVYEDDIGRSAFQKYRKEREAAAGRSSDESQNFDFGLDQTTTGAQDYSVVAPNDDTSRDLAHSPSLSSSERKRSTNSTSHSEARSSTAATSVASQPVTAAASPAVAPTQPAAPASAPAPAPSMQSSLKRADTKTRRLYEQGLDQHMHEQQTSALSRLNSIHRQRTLTNGKQSPPVLQSTKSASNLHDKARQPVYALGAQNPESASPPLTAFGAIRKQSNAASPIPSGPVSPSTPVDFDEQNALTQALEPGDRGKATAMGAFNKPKQSFDEQQYMERQRQLQRTTSSAANKKEPSGPIASQQRIGQLEQERELIDSTSSTQSPSAPNFATKTHEPSTAYNVFQRAAQMNTQPGVQQFDKSSLPDTHRTFFGNISASDSEEEEEDQSRFNHPAFASPDYGYGTHHGRWQPTALPSVREHPALRSHRSKPSLAEEDEDVEPMPMLNTQASASPAKDSTTQIKFIEDVDSPTLGPGASATPLNGLMHHLRQQSNVSSVFPSDDRPSFNESRESQTWNPKNLDLINPTLRNTVDSDSPYTSSNPFDLEEMSTFRGSERADERTSRASISPIEGPRPSAQFDSRAPSRSTFLNRQSAVSDMEPDTENETSWQAELQKHHTRDPSTATQQERDAFARELAARRNAIQENMKSMVETQSRESSPAPPGGRKAFGMLRSKPSGESIENVPRAHAPPKAMKMLGINGPPPSTSSNALNSPYERGGYSLDIGRPRDDSSSRAPMPPLQSRALQQSEQEIKREWQQSRSRENSESRPGRPSPASSAGGRSRANSEVATGRSRSRTGPYRDDLEKAMIEGTGSSAAGVPDLSPMLPRELTPRPSPDIVQHQFDVPRARSNSRTGMTNYFDQKSLQPIQTNGKDRLTPGAPSPATLSPNVYSPAASVSGRPSPTIPFAQNMTPPLSGTNTPLSATFTPPQIPPSSGRPNGVLRKKTISKGDISEPTLISSTSNVDTIDLPEGASLKNGMDEPPPLPPINPRRRAGKSLFGLGSRKESEESVPSYGSRSKTPDDVLAGRPYAVADFPLDAPPPRGPRSVSQNQSPRMPKQSFDQMRSHTMPLPNTGSPERSGGRSPAPPVPPAPPVGVEGGMF